MKVEIKVPAMGESISEATIGAILKPAGSYVKTDEELLELETDKVNQVLYAPQSGVISYAVKPEETVKIGQVIGYIDAEAEAPKGVSKPKEPEPSKPKEIEPSFEPSLPEPSTLKPIESQAGARETKESFINDLKTPRQASPAAFKPASSSQPQPQPGQRETRKKMSKIRKVIATRLVQAQQTTAMLTTFNEADLYEVMALREKYKESFQKEHGVRLGFMSFFVKAVVSALKTVPALNSYIDGDDMVHREFYDIGVAVGTDRGVIVPIVRDCDKLTFAGIESVIEGHAKSAREGTITADDLQGGGFTITNGGVYGSLLSTPILTPPQSGILGMHKIQKRPVVIDDQVVIRPMMYLALSYDHRIVDGKEAVSFLVHIKNCLEDPSRLLLEI